MIETKWELPAYDRVFHPPHYTTGNIEAIDAIESSMSADEFRGYLKGNVMKYLWRYDKKGQCLQDLEKAIWYLNRMLDYVEKAYSGTYPGDTPTENKGGSNVLC